MMNCSRLLSAVAVVVLVLPITACDPDDVPIAQSAPPTFIEVVSTADGLRTSYAPDTANASFAFFTHSDVFDNNACGDLAVAPDGIMRALAVIRPDTAPRSRALVIRTGLGPANWSTTFTSAIIPDTAIGFGNVPQCTPLRMGRVRDGLHAIVWTNQNTDSLFNAVYNSDNPQTLAFGQTIRRPPALVGVSPRRMSLAGFDDQVVLTWTDTAGARINSMRGTITPNGITFNTGVGSTAVNHLESSDVVVADNAMHIAIRTANGVELRRRTALNQNYVVQATCTGSGPFRGRLLFRDANNVWWVSESAMPQNSTNVRLRSFSDCTTRDISAPIVFGQMYYFPGRGVQPD